MSVSSKLSKHGTNLGIGTYSKGKVNDSSANKIPHPEDTDHDGKPDHLVEQELSEPSRVPRGRSS